MTSTSRSGSSVPMRLDADLVVLAEPAGLRALVAEAGVAYQTFHGVAGRCCTKARTTDAVPSGRSAMWRSPLSSKSYISLRDDVGAPRRAAGTRRCPRTSGRGPGRSRPLGLAGERGDQRLPARRLRRQHVLGADGGAEGLGHDPARLLPRRNRPNQVHRRSSRPPAPRGQSVPPTVHVATVRALVGTGEHRMVKLGHALCGAAVSGVRPGVAGGLQRYSSRGAPCSCP